MLSSEHLEGMLFISSFSSEHLEMFADLPVAGYIYRYIVIDTFYLKEHKGELIFEFLIFSVNITIFVPFQNCAFDWFLNPEYPLCPDFPYRFFSFSSTSHKTNLVEIRTILFV